MKSTSGPVRRIIDDQCGGNAHSQRADVKRKLQRMFIFVDPARLGYARYLAIFGDEAGADGSPELTNMGTKHGAILNGLP